MSAHGQLPGAPGPVARVARRANRKLHRVRRRLVRRTAERPSALIVPVPAADPVIERVRATHGLAPQTGVPAHVTLLFPFAPVETLDPDTERAVAALMTRFAPFRFRLAEVSRFPGNLHVLPEPRAPFVHMTRVLAAHWPEYPPYGGAFETIVPHVTVIDGGEPPGLADALADELPLEAVAEHVDLVVQDGERQWVWRARFPFGRGRSSEPAGRGRTPAA